MDDNYRQLRGTWIALAVVVPLVPIVSMFLPLLAQALLPQDRGVLAAATLLVGYAVGIGLVVFHMGVTRRLVALQRLRMNGGPTRPDSSWYSALAVVEACWVFLVIVLGILGLSSIG